VLCKKIFVFTFGIILNKNKIKKQMTQLLPAHSPLGTTAVAAPHPQWLLLPKQWHAPHRTPPAPWPPKPPPGRPPPPAAAAALQPPPKRLPAGPYMESKKGVPCVPVKDLSYYVWYPLLQRSKDKIVGNC
jgi:hypothetical protein